MWFGKLKTSIFPNRKQHKDRNAQIFKASKENHKRWRVHSPPPHLLRLPDLYENLHGLFCVYVWYTEAIRAAPSFSFSKFKTKSLITLSWKSLTNSQPSMTDPRSAELIFHTESREVGQRPLQIILSVSLLSQGRAKKTHRHHHHHHHHRGQAGGARDQRNNSKHIHTNTQT